MLFPYSTDAPIYYWPYTTVAMICVNVLLFGLELTHPDVAEALSLATGKGLHPIQWLTCNFMHAGPMHLIGNMIFLWSFGLIVEGKLGWRRTLAVYLGIGVIHGATIQVLMLGGHEGHVLGASAIVYGFMAISLLWAPENSLQCVLVFGWYILRREFAVKSVVLFFLILQVVVVVFTRAELSSELLHTVGAAMGFAIGTWLLKKKLVDCESWDLFSILAGRNTMSGKERDEEVLRSPEYVRRQEEKAAERSAEALEWIRVQTRQGNFMAAATIYGRLVEELPQLALPEEEQRHLIAALTKERLFAEAIPIMADYLKRHTECAEVVRLKLAQALLAEKRPVQATKVLAKLDEGRLAPQHRQLAAAMREKAQALHEEDPYEVADQNW